mgnify:CR=1 FL=1
MNGRVRAAVTSFSGSREAPAITHPKRATALREPAADSSTGSFVGGGRYNNASAPYGTVSGRFSNDVDADYGEVGGGRNNQVTGNYGPASGGKDNVVQGSYAVANGGTANEVGGS